MKCISCHSYWFPNAQKEFLDEQRVELSSVIIFTTMEKMFQNRHKPLFNILHFEHSNWLLPSILCIDRFSTFDKQILSNGSNISFMLHASVFDVNENFSESNVGYVRPYFNGIKYSIKLKMCQHFMEEHEKEGIEKLRKKSENRYKLLRKCAGNASSYCIFIFSIFNFHFQINGWIKYNFTQDISFSFLFVFFLVFISLCQSFDFFSSWNEKVWKLTEIRSLIP